MERVALVVAQESSDEQSLLAKARRDAGDESQNARVMIERVEQLRVVGTDPPERDPSRCRQPTRHGPSIAYLVAPTALPDRQIRTLSDTRVRFVELSRRLRPRAEAPFAAVLWRDVVGVVLELAELRRVEVAEGPVGAGRGQMYGPGGDVDTTAGHDPPTRKPLLPSVRQLFARTRYVATVSG